MAELRWVLLALGVMLVAGIYLWGRGLFNRSEGVRSGRRRRRSEPRLTVDDEPVSDDVLFAAPGTDAGAGPTGRSTARQAPQADVEDLASTDDAVPAEQAEQSRPAASVEKVIALRFVPRAAELDPIEAVDAMQEAGLRHGRYGIFHYHDPSLPGEPKFSVASLTEPGSFDLDRLTEKPLAGMSFFMILPGAGDPVDRFDAMVETARSLAHRLDAELFDDRGSSWSIQRERYIREELISYRLQSAPS